MGQKIHIVSHFKTGSGRLVSDSGAMAALGNEAGTFAPYELLLGALSFCLFRTFESLAEKMKVGYEGMDMHINGEKRDEKVATLQTCHIQVTAKGVEDQEKFTKAFETATRYCSIFNTLNHVATMTWDIAFA
ncbi:MAG: OsmC family protein [Sphaerochaetaceae bacterium]